MDYTADEMQPEKKEPVTTRRPPPAPRGTGQSVVTILIRNVAPVLVACLVALIFRYFNTSSTTSTIETFPVSLVLKQNLRLAKRSWEHGVLTHALLELQNPELTVFAGPGYGFTLRGATNLEAFPDGKLPKCASEGGGSKWGRYDKWINVKGLRYAAEKIDIEGKWLFDGGNSAADAASLGWAALLLERARATDPMVPVEARRNLFGEAADRMVKWLIEENPKFLVSVEGEGDPSIPLRKIGENSGRRWAISHQSESKQLWTDSVFMVPPFLAAYAVARQNETWLREAVEQVKIYREMLSISVLDDEKSFTKENSGERRELWKHIVSPLRSLGEGVCCHDEGLWLTGNAWALAGIIRVYGVLHRWDLSHNSVKSARLSSTYETRDELKANMKQAALALMLALHLQHLTEDGLLPNYLASVDTEYSQWTFGDAAGTALIASSVYRAAQMGILGEQKRILLAWADSRYNAVARKINSKGLIEDVTTVDDVPAKEITVGTSEGQSFALMMFAARRDCVKLKICL